MACGPEAMAEDKQIGNTLDREKFSSLLRFSLLSVLARSFLSLSRCHFLRRCAAALLWTHAEGILCDLVSTLSVAFFFWFGKFLLISMVFLLFFAFCVCL
jgi:hypothetical protein